MKTLTIKTHITDTVDIKIFNIHTMNVLKLKQSVESVFDDKNIRDEAWYILMMAPKNFRKEFFSYEKIKKGNLCCLVVDSAKKYLVDNNVLKQRESDHFGKQHDLSQYMTLDELKDKAASFSDETFGKDNEKRLIPVLKKFQNETQELLDAIASKKSKDEVNDEFADVFALLIDLYRMYHGNDVDMQTLINITSNKLDICKTRTWGEPDENGVRQHIK